MFDLQVNTSPTNFGSLSRYLLSDSEGTLLLKGPSQVFSENIDCSIRLVTYTRVQKHFTCLGWYLYTNTRLSFSKIVYVSFDNCYQR